MLNMCINLKSVLILLATLSCIHSDKMDDTEGGFMQSTYTVQCSQRKEISPCNCHQNLVKPMRISVECQKMRSFADIIKTLSNKFERSVEVHLLIEFSNLEDLAQGQFKDLHSSIHWIWFRKNEMGGYLPQKSFEGIDSVTHLVLIDSKINQFPGAIFTHMPNVDMFTIERTYITSISPTDFKSLRKLRNLVITRCNLTYIESDTFPPTLKKINLVDNNISTLNYTLRNNTDLELVFLGNNQIESIEDQFADLEPNTKLSLLDLSHNKLSALPKSFKNLIGMKNLYLQWNRISGLDGILKTMHQLTQLDLTGNHFSELSRDEFKECMALTTLNLSLNEISNLNKSLLPLKSVETLNLTYNKLREFSIDEIIGLTKIDTLDLSFNKIKKFIGKIEKDTVLPETVIINLSLEFNELEILEGSLAEIKGLTHLNMSHNRLSTIPTAFLDGLQELKYLDVSYNNLHSLHDIAKATLPSLQYLEALFNEITELTRESNEGFTAVCFMHLEFNKIEVLNVNFTEKNQCMYNPGVNETLYIYLDGNEVLCRSGSNEVTNELESKNATKIVGKCSSMDKRLEYIHPNLNERSPIIVDIDGSTLIPKT